ncbi:MAG: polysaccharide deacetylase family protein [Acidimicrobiia bacterium]|nr:polysaccharide deacetylase family protein [Acidimicrobiia bacterium]
MTLAVASYHKIGAEPPPGNWESWYYVSEPAFERQLEEFASAGWTVVGVDTLRAAVDASESVPPKALLLTFDDGYRSFGHTALPVLQRFGYPAVLFVPTDHIGGSNVWDRDEEPEEAICDWGDLRYLHESGIAIQSHAASHRAFSKLSSDEWREELYGSRCRLEDQLCSPVDIIAYPYGDDAAMPEDLRVALANAGYRVGCLYGGGPNSVPLVDQYRVSRLALGPDSDISMMLAQSG